MVLEPNRKVLGGKCRSDLPAVLAELSESDPESLLLEIEAGIAALAGYEITMEDIEIAFRSADIEPVIIPNYQTL